MFHEQEELVIAVAVPEFAHHDGESPAFALESVSCLAGQHGGKDVTLEPLASTSGRLLQAPLDQETRAGVDETLNFGGLDPVGGTSPRVASIV